MKENEIKEFVKKRYSKIATKEELSCCSSCSGDDMEVVIKQAKAAGYSDEEIKSIPSDAIFGLGCGNPTALAEIKEGETVLDLGSGGGIDVFLAAGKVGDQGKVIGVDMTEEMVKTAVKTAETAGYENVEFKQGDIENLPIEDNSIDVIISNCVINLTTNKSAAFKEVFRVLKDGGRILISDIVTEGKIPDEVRKSFQAWSECVAGALEKEEYLETIKKAGFKDVEIIDQHYFTEPDMDERLVGKITSVQLRALKEETMRNNNKTSCCEENMEESPILNEDVGCCGGIVDEQFEEKSEESDECGCGCGGEFPDESLVKNPDKPKNIADPAFLEEFEKFAHSLGIKAIGYTQLTPELLIQNKFVQYTNAVVLTMEMSKELIETAPGDKTQEINDAHYAKLGTLSYKLSDYLRENGYATEVAHPYGGLVNFCTLAQKAGIGFIGKSGLLITPESGPRQKISAIFVSIANLPVKEDNEHIWIPDYCEKCGKCIRACPEKALTETETCCSGKQVEFDQKLCIGCSQGCTYCIEACPFHEKGYEQVKNKFDKLNAKLKEIQNKKFKPELWDNWAKQNSSLFAGLIDGATIAITMTQNNEKIVLLEKEGNDINVSIKPQKEELESPIKDLMFDIDEKDMGKLLNDTTSIKFIDLLSSGKIGVYVFKSQPQLIDKGYMGFLNRLGLRIGGGSCCG